MQIVLIKIETKNGDSALIKKLCYFFKETMPDDFTKTIPLAAGEFIAVVEPISMGEAKQYTLDSVIDSLKI